MTEPKSYDLRAPLAQLAMLSMERGEITVANVRSALEVSTIPDDRLDFAASETVAMVPQLRALAALMTLGLGRKPTFDEVLKALPRADWVDDDKNLATIGVTVEGGDGEQYARFEVQHKIQ